MLGKLRRRFDLRREQAANHVLPALPEEGHLYSFRTRPYTPFSASETGRYAALKVLGVTDKLVVIAALEPVWPSHPPLKEAAGARVLSQYRFAHKGRDAIFGVLKETWDIAEALDDCRLLGSVSVSARDLRVVDDYERGVPGCSYVHLAFANFASEGEWRWTNDREALVRECELRDAEAARKRAEQEARYRERLKGLTLEKLLSETPFANWSPSPPYPPQEFSQAARAAIHAACREIQALGEKPRRPAVRKILKSTVEWFNQADEAAGHVIETEEREDIVAVLEEIAHAAKQKALVGEIDDWRDW